MNSSNERLQSIDALRGIAVILMIMQNLPAWLWSEPLRSINFIYNKSPVIYYFDLFGFLSAPLFVMLSGFGSVFLISKSSSRVFYKRGALIILIGVLLNLITPHWFFLSSWYVLHLIGLALILFPYLNRLKSRYLLIITAVFFLLTPLLQTIISSPLFITNKMMSRLDSVFDIFRIIMVEGYFPVFPWLGIFIMGIASARWYLSGTKVYIAKTGVILIFSGVILTICYKLGFPFATYGFFFRFFVFQISIFPVQPAFFLPVFGISMILLYVVLLFDVFNKISPLSYFGKTSLSIFIFHFFIFEEAFRLIGIYRKWDSVSTVLIIIMFIFLLGFLLFQWKRVDFKYGLEYFIKKIYN